MEISTENNNNPQQTKSDSYKNKFEIEERVAILLKPYATESKSFDQIRQTNSKNISQRIKYSQARELHWSNLAIDLTNKNFPLLNIKKDTETYTIIKNFMSESQNNQNLDSNAIAALAEVMKQFLVIHNDKTDRDLIPKPAKYDGTMDANIIEIWIRSIEDYQKFRSYTSEQTCILAVNLLSDTAKIWYLNMQLQSIEPTDWLSFKHELRSYFKPENSVMLYREQIRNLKQTSSITQYIHSFLRIKLGIPNMNDEEAVDRFIDGLRDRNTKSHIRDNINLNSPTLSEAISAAQRYEGNRQEFRQHQGSSNNAPTPIIDDPMDLSVIQRGNNFRRQQSGSSGGGFFHGNNNYRNGGGYRGGSYRGGDHRGGRSRGGGSFRGNNSYRGGVGSGFGRNNGGQNERACWTCGRTGHVARECRSGLNRDHHQVNYIGYNNDNYYSNNRNYYDEYQYNYTDDISPDKQHNYDHDNDDIIVTDTNNKDKNSSSYDYLCTTKETKNINLPDLTIFKKDIEFVLNANTQHTKLPVYQAFINNCPVLVLIDSGASENYVHSRLLPVVSHSQQIQGQSVETANGQQSQINSKANFTLKLGDYKGNIDAFIFDTKFDLILGTAWLMKVLPVPNWFDSTWEIPITDDEGTRTLCKIEPYNKIDASNESKKVENAVQTDIHNWETCDYVLSAKQFERLLKKNQVEECFLVQIEEILEPIIEVNNMEIAQNIETDNQNNEKKLDQLWCEEFEKSYPKVFKGTLDTLPPIRHTTGNMIELVPGSHPISKSPYRMSPLELKELRRQLDDLLKKGFIAPCASEWGSPVLFVKKPNGDLRMVCDYRSLNKYTIAQNIPVPRIDESLEQMHGANFFTSLDLASGF